VSGSVCVSAENDDFEAWVPVPSGPDDPAYRSAIGAVAAHLNAHPPPHQLIPLIHVEMYPAEGQRLRLHYGLGGADGAAPT
jgi:hypothetical protein